MNGSSRGGVRRVARRLRALLVLLAVASLGSFACSGEAVPHVDLDGDLDSLRAAFNADADQVRAILLASPT